MEIYIRDGDGNLCRVLNETKGFYHVERIKDKQIMPVPRNSATLVKMLESFPGDWAIKTA